MVAVETADVIGPAAPASPCAVWRPVLRGGRVVELVLAQVHGDRQLLGLPAGPEPYGRTMTSLLPDAAVDGRLAALCAVAETGVAFRLTRPASLTRSPVLLTAHRSDDGDVVVRIEPRPAEPSSPGRGAQRWQRMFDDTRLGVLVLTLDGYVLEANPAICAMLARPQAEVVGVRFHDFTAPGDAGRVDREALLRTGHASLQKRYLRGDGRQLELRSTISLIVEDGERRMLSLCEDVTQAQDALSELAHRATHDGLTGLANREALRGRLDSELAQVGAGAADVGLLFLDLDRFKVINDSLGHAAGDRLLREVADRLQAGVPAEDLLGRLGGDEFAVVTRATRADALARRLVEALSVPFVLDGREVTVGASIGIAVRERGQPDRPAALDPDEPGDVLLREADTAMYAAKRAGHGQVVRFRETLRRRALARLEDEQGLRRALQRSELRVHYQPIVRLHDGRTVAVEALVRWQHPERGLLPPGAFLSIAEEAGLVVPLGRYVLQRACAELAGRPIEGEPLRMSVNIAAQHLAAGTLRSDVEQALSDAGLEPSRLTLEITEQALVVSHVRAAQVLADLRRRGCRVALDDFGTGYSSLAYLRQLPVDVLKIDRTFVTGAGTGANDSALLSAITALGSSLGLDTVVEGIETPAELDAARAAGASHAQGQLLGHPIPPT